MKHQQGEITLLTAALLLVVAFAMSTAMQPREDQRREDEVQTAP